MNKLLGQVCIILVCIALVAIAGYVAGAHHEKSKLNVDGFLSEGSVTCDTCYIYDTVRIDRPVYRELRIVDTVIVAVSDTVKILGDTAVAFPFEERVYIDSTYKAVVSGFRPSLDSISVYPRTSIITIYNNEVEGQKKRWGLGVQAGYGVSGDGLTPYIGVGISYNLLQW